MGAEGINDKSAIGRLNEAMRKGAVAVESMTDSKILGWLSNVTFTEEETTRTRKTKDITTIQKYILPVFKKLAKTHPYIIMTLMNYSDFQINLSSDKDLNNGFHCVSYIRSNCVLPNLQISFNPNKISLDKFQEGLYKKIIEYSDELFKTRKYKVKILAEAQKKLKEAVKWRSMLENLPDGSVKDKQLKDMEDGLEELKKEIRDLKASQ